MDQLALTRELLGSLHIQGTCIQVSDERTVLAYNGKPLQNIVEENPGKNIYFLANIPAQKQRAAPHARHIYDVDIPLKKYVVFDVDIRKTVQDLPLDQQDLHIMQAAQHIESMLATSDRFRLFRALVHTGNGIHIYYTSLHPVAVTIAQYTHGYKGLAQELSDLCGFQVDPACSNIARIIRLPSSFNNKTERALPVQILSYHNQHSTLLEDLMLYKHIKDDTHIDMDIFLRQIQSEPILSLCQYFGINVTRDHYVEMNGEKTSIKLNVQSNLVKRFSDKPGSGNFIHLYAALHNLSFTEAAEMVSEQYTHKKLMLGEKYEKQANHERIQKERRHMAQSGYIPLVWNTEYMTRRFPVIKNYAYVVLAGETKSGKSTVAFDLSVKNARLGRTILYITLEMSREQMMANIARTVADIDPVDERHYLQYGVYPGEKHAKYTAKLQELEAITSLVVVGKEYGKTMTIDDITDTILTYPNVDGVVIDNLDKIDRRPTDKDDFEKQKTVSHALLEFTSNFLIPVILVHHLKKGQDTPGAHLFRSTNALSGTSKISHDADMVLFVARPKDAESGTFKDNGTFIRVMETREFEPCMHRVFFVNGTFVDDDVSRRIFENCYKNTSI